MNQPLFFDPVLAEKQETEKIHLRKTMTQVGVTLILFLAIVLVLSFIIRIFITITGYNPFEATGSFAEIISSVLEFIISASANIIPAIYLFNVLDTPFNLAGMFRIPDKQKVVHSLGLFVGVLIISLVIVNFITGFFTELGLEPIQPKYEIPTSPFAMILFVISIAIAPPLFEEFVFRGVILHSLRKFGDGFAIFVTAILFGAMHQTIPQAINAFIIGLALGFFVVKTGSLWTGILLHFVNNLLATTGMLAEMTGNDVFNFINGLLILTLLVLMVRSYVDYFKNKQPSFNLNYNNSSLSIPQALSVTFKNPVILIACSYLVINLAFKFIRI
jgi:membrane protease YdiL (CAAX protease family)